MIYIYICSSYTSIYIYMCVQHAFLMTLLAPSGSQGSIDHMYAPMPYSRCFRVQVEGWEVQKGPSQAPNPIAQARRNGA